MPAESKKGITMENEPKFQCAKGKLYEQDCNELQITTHPDKSVTTKCIKYHTEPVKFIMARLDMFDKEIRE